MSLSSSRIGYRHRCTIERDAAAGTKNGWGGQQAPDWQPHLSELPCRGWNEAGVTAARETEDGEKTVVISARRLSVALGTDVTEADRVAAVVDREGTTVFDGPMGIEGILRLPDHLELVLERIR